MDIGTGAGLPGIPCKIVRLESRSILLERKEKKTAFLKEVFRILNLKNIEALNQNADDSSFRGVLSGMLDLVTMRAVAEPAFSFDIARHYVKSGGSLCLMLTESQIVKIGEVVSIARENGFSPGNNFSYSFKGLNEDRVVLNLLRR